MKIRECQKLRVKHLLRGGWGGGGGLFFTEDSVILLSGEFLHIGAVTKLWFSFELNKRKS